MSMDLYPSSDWPAIEVRFRCLPGEESPATIGCERYISASYDVEHNLRQRTLRLEGASKRASASSR